MLIPDWKPGTSYIAGQLVVFDNDIWVCNQNNSNSRPDFNNGTWQVRAGSNDVAGASNWLYDLFTNAGVFPATYGAKGDGVTDDSAAFIAAATALNARGGGNIIVPYTPNGYIVNQVVNLFDRVKVVGINNPTFKVTAGTSLNPMWRFNALTGGAGLDNITVDGTGGTVAGFLFQNSVRCEIVKCQFTATTCAVTGTSAYNRVKQNRFVSSPATALTITGSVSYNDFDENYFESNTGFGMLATLGAFRNWFTKNWCNVNGIELLGITYDAFENIIADNYAKGCGDNGISVTGYRNSLANNITEGNAFHGLALYGAYNTVAGHSSWNNGQAGGSYAGIAFAQGFGGTAQANVVSGFFSDDTQAVRTQAHGIKFNAAGYTAWAAGQVISGAGVYRRNANKLYRSTNGGTTGATPPTWTSGTQSDGTVSWTYLDTFLSPVDEPSRNTIKEYTILRSLTSSIFDGTSRQDNDYSEIPHPGFISGQQYTLWDGAVSNTALAAADTIYLYPIYIPKVINYTAGSIRVATGGAGSSVKMGVWRNGAGQPLGAPVIADNTGAVTTGTGQIAVATGSGTLQPGWYWIGGKGTGTLPTIISAAGAFGFKMPQGASISAYMLSFADAYANALPTFVEGASFTKVNASGAPILGLTVA